VLFEIATEPPGFTLDETIEELGTGLRLPPWLESARQQIQEILPAIHVPYKQ
jgi:glyoxalase family protein